MPIIAGAKAIGASAVGMGEKKVAVGLYDFATDGGAVGAITLRGDTIPAGAILTEALLRVETVPTSGGAATIGVQVEGANDVQASAAITGAPWSTSGAKRATLTATAAPVVTTASRNIVANVGTAALTAGRFQVYIWYVERLTEV